MIMIGILISCTSWHG